MKIISQPEGFWRWTGTYRLIELERGDDMKEKNDVIHDDRLITYVTPVLLPLTQTAAASDGVCSNGTGGWD